MLLVVITIAVIAVMTNGRTTVGGTIATVAVVMTIAVTMTRSETGIRAAAAEAVIVNGRAAAEVVTGNAVEVGAEMVTDVAGTKVAIFPCHHLSSLCQTLLSFQYLC